MLGYLQIKEKELAAKLRDIREEIKAEKIKLATSKYGVAIGSVVLDKGGDEYRVVAIDANWDKPWLIGNPKKKSGVFGIAKRNLYSEWELLKA